MFYLCYVHAHVIAIENSLTVTPINLQLAWLGWYTDSRLRHTAGLIFVLWSKFLKFVQLVEPPCTRVKAETGDKALTSWWAVKVERFQLRKNVQICVLWMQQLLRFQCYLVAVVFSCHVGLSPHLDKNQDYFTDFWKKKKKKIIEGYLQDKPIVKISFSARK